VFLLLLLLLLLQVRLSTAPPTAPGATWYCQIKLRREYSKDNKQLDSAPKELTFKTLNQNQKDSLHHYISAAQRALLNPDTPHDIYVQIADLAAAAEQEGSSSSSAAAGNGAGSSSKLAGLASASSDDLQFTRNVIVLDISGACRASCLLGCCLFHHLAALCYACTWVCTCSATLC
jgi:hypothetical protein